MPSRSGTDLLIQRSERPVRRRLPMLGGVMLVFALGLALGRLSAPGDGPDPIPVAPLPEASADPARLSVEDPGPAASRTRAGAARTVARALSALADPQLLSSPEARRAVVARIAPPGYRAELAPLFERTYGYLDELLGAAADRGEVVLRMTPLGYRVEAFSSTRASVAVWQVTLLATPERAPIAAWSTSRAELVWSGGRWRVERFGTDTPGPVPAVTAPDAPVAASEFVASAQGFSPFPP
ncbi:MAG: hypothetical protein AB7V42_10720 [Thermoleophilia bacterium]